MVISVCLVSLQDIMETSDRVAYKQNVIINYLAFHML